MSNRNERNRLKSIKRIRKLLGEHFHVNSNNGGFTIYSYNDEKHRTHFYAHIRPMGTEWVLTCKELGINWQGSPLRVGVNLIRSAALLVV